MSAPPPQPEPYAKTRFRLRAALVALFGFVGAVHIIEPNKLLPIMPDWVPRPLVVIVATGLCELLGCVGLMLPQTRHLAGVCLALYGACVFPANLKHALGHIPVEGLPDSWWYHAPRLAFQPVLIWAPLFAAGVIRWPFRTTGDAP